MATVTPRTIRAAECRVMPWRNGQGSTTEIAVEPLGAGLDTFDWRISIAEIRGSGPFSRFPGYDRIIMQLDGLPMSLTHQGRAPVVLEQLWPHAFAGDDETTCTVDGVAHDFNLIVRRGTAWPTLRVYRLGDGEELVYESAAAMVLHVLEGALAVADGIQLNAGDTRVTDAAEIPAHGAEERSVVLVATLT